MKKCILSALAGAVTMFVLLTVIANIQTAKAPQQEEYEHIDYVSSITEAACYVCGESGDTAASAYWGEDNVGLINLNNFDLLYLGINRYGDGRELIQEPAGVMLSCGIMNQEADTYAHAYVYPDRAYASLQITGVQYTIDRELLQSRLCQTCLDSINSLWFTTRPPAEYAVISFEERTIQPILNAHPWFGIGNFGVDCEFHGEGIIDLLVHYCPNRYE